ncbi:MAG TPA: hypothetical protein PLT47_09480 [Bacteroidales bacterium]|nr:hypothetical protein [Bacteroidales bacterium]
MIFSTAYLPPISFFVYATLAKEIRIEACENFINKLTETAVVSTLPTVNSTSVSPWTIADGHSFL